MATKKLLSDPRYKAFVERYAFDLVRFCVEVCGITPTWQQIELFESVERPGSRTSVSSGHGTGKTASFSVIALWHLLCYYNSNTFLTGPKLGTIQQGVWKEFADRKLGMSLGPHAWVVDFFEIEHEKVYVAGCKLNWFIAAKTAPKGSPENLAGTHRDWLLWLADEASGIPDANFGVIGGALTDARNRFAMASQPTRPSGFFYETHNALSTINGGPWNSLVFNSEESPLVSEQFIRDKLLEYGGTDSVEYQIKVQGRFPENSDKYLLGRKVIERLIDGPEVIHSGEFFGNLVIVDVAAGVHRDKTVATHVRVIGNGDRSEPDARRVEVVAIPVYTNAMDWTPLAKIISEYAANLSNATIIVDTHGMGVQFAKKIEEFGAPNVMHSNWGGKPFKKKYRERFFNLRAQCTVHAAEAVKDGRIRFIQTHKKDLLDQGSRLPFFIDERGLWHIARKEDMADDGLPSPDLWDTICMAFLEGAHYIQSQSGYVGQMDDRKALARERAKDAFAGVE